MEALAAGALVVVPFLSPCQVMGWFIGCRKPWNRHILFRWLR